MSELRPSKEMWDYYFKVRYERKEITPLSVCSAIADVMGGYHISYTDNEVLKDLKLFTKGGKLNKKAMGALASYLHKEFHGSKNGLKILPPKDCERSN